MSDGWIAPKVYHMCYVDKNINGWERRIDNDFEMLECPKCKCRVKALHYIVAVGTHGFNFCPYCGEDLRPSQLSMFDDLLKEAGFE